MSFEFGMKGFTFAMIALICWGVSILLSVLGIGGFLTWILGVAIIVLAILAFINGKKELAADPSNKKAKTGKIIGLVVIILEIVSLVLIVLSVALLASLLV